MSAFLYKRKCEPEVTPDHKKARREVKLSWNSLVSLLSFDTWKHSICFFLPLSYVPQSSPTPYYTFYYDTGYSDEEELEEQVLRNTVNSEALMTAFHQNQPGNNGNKVEWRHFTQIIKLYKSFISKSTWVWIKPRPHV